MVIERPSPWIRALRLFEGTLIFSRIFDDSGDSTAMGSIRTDDDSLAASLVFLR